MKELPTYTPDFEEYIRQGEPDKRERAQIWRTAIGLQQVDGLDVSEYFKESVKRNIEGEISIDEVQKLTKAYYVSKTNRAQDDDEKEEADKVAGNISKILASQTLDFSTNGYISLHRRIQYYKDCRTTQRKNYRKACRKNCRKDSRVNAQQPADHYS